MRPDEGTSKPASMRSRVVLPQPDEPSNAKISPRVTSRLTWSTARVSPKSFVKAARRRKAPSIGATFMGALSANGLEVREGAGDEPERCLVGRVRRDHGGQGRRVRKHGRVLG